MNIIYYKLISIRQGLWRASETGKGTNESFVKSWKYDLLQANQYMSSLPPEQIAVHKSCRMSAAL